MQKELDSQMQGFSDVKNCEKTFERGSLVPSAGQNEGKKETKVFASKQTAGMQLVKLFIFFQSLQVN